MTTIRSLVAVAILAVATPARAQLVSTLDVGAASVVYEGGLESSSLAVTPSLRLEHANAWLGATGTLSRFQDGTVGSQGVVGGSLFSPAVARLRAELAGSAGGSTHQDATRTGQMLGEGRIHWASPSGGAWAGGGVGRTWDGVLWRNLTTTEAGIWSRLGSLLLVGSVTPTVIADTGFTDLVGSARWNSGPFEVTGNLGSRRSATMTAVRWAGVGASYWILHHVAITAGAGSYPTDFRQGLPGGRFVSGGLRLASRPPVVDPATLRAAARRPAAARPVVGAMVVEAGRLGVRTLRVTAPAARRVELMGDFTDWKVVTLRRAGGDVWEITLPMSSGTHRFNVRADGGEWGVPSGVTTLTDDFNGVVGLLTVR